MADSNSQEKNGNNEVALDPAMVVELKRVLLEYGNALLTTTGDSIEKILNELDGLEDLLLHLGQACKSVVEESLEPAKKALISDKLLRHAEEDVRITVASCISEIIRITAPDEPGKDLLAGDGILESPVKKKRSSTRVFLRKGLDKNLLGNRIDGIQKPLEKGQGSSNKVDHAEKSQCKSITSEDISGDILIKTLVSRSRNICSKGVTDSVEVSSRRCQNEVILPKQENQSKKRRRSLSKKAPRDTCENEASKVNQAGKCFGEDLVGRKIKVWWPLYKTYYEGKVTSFNSLNMKHQVDYDDGGIETLDLAHQCWEMIDDNLSSHEQNMVPSSTVKSRDSGRSSTSSSRKKLKGLWKQILG